MQDNISYTPEEVAQILKISRFTVYELIKRGELTGYKVGRKVRVEAGDLERYKQQSKGGVQTVSTTIQVAGSVSETCVVCGQDPVLDILTRHLERQLPQVRFLRNYVGSMDGLNALYHGTAHIVTAHLWDGDTGQYNVPYIRHLLPGHRAVIINLMYRAAGFYVAKGNPKKIYRWEDLLRPEITVVNRERGSGARVLLDEQLRKHNLEYGKINGYNREELSHLAIASCVARGEADVGIGIEKAAQQVAGIDFVPLQREQYDLVIRKSDVQQPYIQTMYAVLKSTAFRNEVAGMGGYDISRMGDIISET